MSPVDLIEALRHLAKVGFGYDISQADRISLHCAADALASKDAALAEIRAEYLNASHDAMKLAAELARVKKALEPFEELADEGNDDQPDDTKVVVHAGRSIIYTLRLSDLRRARAASRAISQDGEERT